MNTFLGKKALFFLLIINTLLYFKSPWWIFSIFLVLTLYLLYLFRESGPIYKDNFKNPKNIFLSPIFGQVIQINYNVSHAFFGKDLVELHLKTPRTGPIGLYLPMSCDIVEVFKNSKGHFWRSLRETDPQKEIYLPFQNEKLLASVMIKFKSVLNQSFGIQIIKNLKDFWPDIWVEAGDRGKVAACFGFFPLGGTVLMYLPKDCEVLTKIGAELIAGETPVAAKL